MFLRWFSNRYSGFRTGIKFYLTGGRRKSEWFYSVKAQQGFLNRDHPGGKRDRAENRPKLSGCCRLKKHPGLIITENGAIG